VAEAIEYDWTDKFKIKNIIETKDSIIRPFENNLPYINDLTRDQAISLGFKKWSSDNEFLIPLYLKQFINPEQKCFDIFNCIKILKDVDSDHRGGMIGAYIVIE